MRSFTAPVLLATALCAAAFAAIGCGGQGLPPAGDAAQTVPAGDGTRSARDFVISHRAELEREIATGSGQQLYELSIIVHCQNLPELDLVLHKHYAEIFPTPPPSDAEVAERVVKLLRERKELVCRDLETGPGRPFAAGRHRVFSENHNWHSRIGELSVLQRLQPPDR